MHQNATGELRAFVLARVNAHSWIVDLLLNYELTVGSGEDASIRIESPAVLDKHAALLWNGKQIVLRVMPGAETMLVNGEPVDERVVVQPGDEIKIGDATLVVSVTVAPMTPHRRSLTHHEFCERLAEELARGASRMQQTCLVMIKAKSGDGSALAKAALSSFRVGDTVGTYAHDEIEFLLPDTTPNVARAVVGRLLETSAAPGTGAGLAAAPTDGDSPERLLRAARDALAMAIKQGGGISRPVYGEPEHAEPSVHSPTTRLVLEDLTEAAGRDQPVLLTGEPSSGKRYYARLIHDRGPRAKAPFVVISCAALVDPSALDTAFGDENGNVAGCKAAQARSGTLVLAAVGDLPMEGQKRLLALLEKEEPGSFNLVSTTHRDLMSLCAAGAFLEDLYSRLAVIRVGIPALRMRTDSIVPLAQNFAAEYTPDAPVRLSVGAVEKMRGYTWPGNVLELRNAMERAVRLAGGGEILAEHLPGDVSDASVGRGQLRRQVGSVERDAIIKTLADNNYNQTHTARQLGISRRALIYKMEKYGLKPPPSSSRRDDEEE